MAYRKSYGQVTNDVTSWPQYA